METLKTLVKNFKSFIHLSLREENDWQAKPENPNERFKTKAIDQTKTSLWTLDLRQEVEKRKEMSIEERANLNNKELLTFDLEERLELVTDPIVDYSDIENWTTKKIKFFFDQKQNRDLFIKTTAWQLLPPNVREVELGWEKYSRESLYWEFFNKQNERLIIKDGTKINITKIENQAYVDSIKVENSKTFEQFKKQHLEINPKSDSVEKFPDLIKWAINRWIDPNFAIVVFWSRLKSEPMFKTAENWKQMKNKNREIMLEDMLAEFDRVRWMNLVSNKLVDWKYDNDLTIELLMKFNKNNWKEIAEDEFKITKEIINTSEVNLNSEENRVSKIKSINIETTRDFKRTVKIMAKEIEKVYWIPWQVTAWQCVLESNWGKSKLSTEWNNYFWIKSFGKWPSIRFSTEEVFKWRTTRIKDWFKVFDDMKESFIGYAKFLVKNKRYRNAFKYWAKLDETPEYYPKDYMWYDPKKFIEEIKNAWYATDPNYVTKVMWTWNKFENLA